MKIKTTWKSMKNLKISVDQQTITQKIMMKNIWKSNLAQMMIYTLELHSIIIAARSVFHEGAALNFLRRMFMQMSSVRYKYWSMIGLMPQKARY